MGRSRTGNILSTCCCFNRHVSQRNETRRSKRETIRILGESDLPVSLLLHQFIHLTICLSLQPPTDLISIDTICNPIPNSNPRRVAKSTYDVTCEGAKKEYLLYFLRPLLLRPQTNTYHQPTTGTEKENFLQTIISNQRRG